jgi:hypothetical protein
MNSVISVLGVPGYAVATRTPASQAPRAIASFPNINCCIDSILLHGGNHEPSRLPSSFAYQKRSAEETEQAFFLRSTTDPKAARPFSLESST